MALQTHEERKNIIWGRIYFIIFAVLIIGGIITKRVFGHPEFMMLWHLPAAVFLVLAGYKTTQGNRKRYREKFMNKALSKKKGPVNS